MDELVCCQLCIKDVIFDYIDVYYSYILKFCDVLFDRQVIVLKGVLKKIFIYIINLICSIFLG